MTVDELLALLESGQLTGIEGVAEDGAVDFKGAPYQLANEASKFELAKDVASFASSLGPSVIVLPVETQRTPDSPFERAVRARPIRRSLVDEAQVRSVIRSHVYPAVRDVAVRVFPITDNEEKCMVAIVIPAQRESDKPFMVLSPLAADDSKVQGWLVGLPTRAVDETEQIRPAELHELINRGRTVASRLEEIVGMLAHGSVAPDPESESDLVAAATEHGEQAAQRFARVSDLHGGFSPPTLFLAATPTQPVHVPSIFQQEGVRQVVENPPHTRYDGWNLITLNRAELVEGTRLRTTSGRRKLVELSEDGTLIAVAPILQLLSRESFKFGENGDVFKLNSLALVEFVHDFALTYQAVAQHFDPIPEEAHFVVGLRAITGSQAGSVVLPPHGLDTYGWVLAELGDEMQLPDAPDFTWAYTNRIDASPGEIAYPLLERVYAYFKHTTDAIPYLNENRNAVDPTKFKRQGG